jgi:hypothetical protein
MIQGWRAEFISTAEALAPDVLELFDKIPHCKPDELSDTISKFLSAVASAAPEVSETYKGLIFATQNYVDDVASK